MDDSYRAARKRMRNPLDRCWWCKEPFEDGDPIGLAGREKKKNVVLCAACVALAREGGEVADITLTDRDLDMAYQYLADAEGLPEEEEAGHLALFLTQARREGMRQATQEIWRLIQKEADARPAFFGCYPYAPLITKFEERYGHLLDITSEGNGI